MRYNIFLIILCLIFNSAIAEQQIKSPEKATNLALKYLGFLNMDCFSVEKNFQEALIVNISDDKTPFLHDKINNRDIWKVTFKDIELSPHRGYPDSDDYPRPFDVYINPNDGSLLKIESIYSGTNIDFAPEPSVEYAEKKLKEANLTFLNFAMPEGNFVSLFEAISNMGPRNFKQLKAMLVMNPGRVDDVPIAVWFVIYRGTDMDLPRSPKADISRKEIYNYTSFIYDATTGRAMSKTTIPGIERDKLK